MFNFHKPRTYRSVEGCCICRAKSSSSRFTDSRKYEHDTMLCFDLKYPRQGEICNACVLLVKRFKRLPVGSKRNWSHVVDARAGPGGSKIQTKNKGERSTSSRSSGGSPTLLNNTNNNNGHGSGSTCSSTSVNGLSYIPEKFTKIFKKSKKLKESSSSSSSSSLGSYSSSSHSHISKQRKSSQNNGWATTASSSSSAATSASMVSNLAHTTDDLLDSDYEDTRGGGSSLTGSGAAGTVVQFQTQTRASAFKAQAAAEARRRILKLGSKRRKCLQPRKYRVTEKREEVIQFFDEDEWTEQKSCCGMLYECPALGGALIVDVANYKPCEKHQQKNAAVRATTTASKTTPVTPQPLTSKTEITKESHPISLVMPAQRNIIQTIPAVVQLQPPQSPAFTLSLSTSSAPFTIANGGASTAATCSSSSLTITKTSTPVLKKHHLFFKRQSESFPQGDMVITPTNDIATTKSTNSSSGPNISKTESEYNNQMPTAAPGATSTTSTTVTKQRHNSHSNSNNENAIQTSTPLSSTSIGGLTTNCYTISSPSSSLSISVTSSSSASSATSAAAAAVSASFSLPTSASTTSYSCNMPQMPKHSLAKVTTISPPLMATHLMATSALSSSTYSTSSSSISSGSFTKSQQHQQNSSSNFLHKIKSDNGGKIVKHSLEKFNTAVRLKTSDLLHDNNNMMKPIIKTVDKSYILAKPPTASNINTLNNIAGGAAIYQTLSSYNCANGGQPLTTTTSLSAASPTSSTSSTSSTKFSDNSSDSGFDENMLDRKSASPLQEDCEKKLLSRPGVQTMFLASGVQIQGQPQNLMLTGNEVAAKILQNRKYSSITATTQQLNNSNNSAGGMTSNVRSLSTSHHHPTTTAVKIAQISTGNHHHHTSSSSSVAAATASASTIMSSAAQAKMRAIYNNNNTIQHENGITTIVPASSLAATTQTAAMQNIAPSSVTITPAPLVSAAGNTGAAAAAVNQFNAQNIISRKLTAANIINLQSNNLSNNNTTTNLNSNHNSNSSSIIMGNHQGTTTSNQKIILLKTTTSSNQQQQHTPNQASSLKYGQIAATTGGGVGGGNGNASMMGR